MSSSILPSPITAGTMILSISPDDDEFEAELQRGEGEGAPQVSDEQLALLDGEAAPEEIKKLHDLKVIEPCAPDPSTIPPEQLVDTTLVNDWRFRGGSWKRIAGYWQENTGMDKQTKTSRVLPAVFLRWDFFWWCQCCTIWSSQHLTLRMRSLWWTKRRLCMCWSQLGSGS